LPNPGKGQKLSCHDKVVNGNGKKPWKHAREPAGLPMLSWRQEFVPVDKLAK